MSIVLSMTSSRNVEEVAIFLKKQLQKTQEADYDKVSFLGAWLIIQFINYSCESRSRNTGSC
jgi:hypothetical protein